MAAQKFINDARILLEERLLELSWILQTAQAAAGEEPAPAWLSLFSKHVEAIDASAQDYMMAVHKHALPLLADVSRLSRA